jgi:hypothetical protein
MAERGQPPSGDYVLKACDKLLAEARAGEIAHEWTVEDLEDLRARLEARLLESDGSGQVQ